MKVNILKFNQRSCFLIAFFAALFFWISFFPEPIQGRYVIYTRVFLCLFFLFLFFKAGSFRNFFHSQDWPLWFFLACVSAGLFSAQDKKLARETYFNLAFNLFFLFYIGKALLSEEESRCRIALVICICSAVAAIIGVLELYFGRNILYENFIANPFYERYIRYQFRPMSTQFNPVILGSYLLGCLPFNFYLLKNKQLYLRLLGISSLLLCLSIILLTASRGVFLGLIALLLFYFWKNQKRALIFSFLICLISLVSICSFLKDVSLSRFGFNRLMLGSYDSIVSEYRLSRVKMTVKILRDYPFFGIGFNHFRIRFNEYCPEKDKGKVPYEFMIPDNMYLTFLSESGIIGTLGFVVFISLLFKKCFKKIREAENDDKRRFLIISLSALTGLLVNMGAYELFYWHNPSMLFCLFCGFAGSDNRFSR